MIIKRIASSFKKQDWFVTTIEVLIVVIGIFLGLQVNEWNDARKASNDGQLYLVNLKKDFSTSVDRIDSALSSKELIKNNLLQLAALEPKDFESFDEEVLDKLILQGLFSTGVHIIERDLYSNMKSMGKFSLIKSEELQNQIITVHSQKTLHQLLLYVTHRLRQPVSQFCSTCFCGEFFTRRVSIASHA